MTEERLDLTVFLIKKNFTDYKEVFKDYDSLEELDIKEKFNLSGKVYIGDNKESNIKWNSLLSNGVVKYTPQFSKSARAVLLVERKKRMFAFTFGYGRYLLNDDSYVRDFGLKIILNNAKIDSLKSIDTSIIDENTLNSRTQTARSSSMDEFNINDIRTMFRAITAESNELKKYGEIISGRDGFNFTYKLNFSNIKTTCDFLIEDYKKERYKTKFPEVDRIMEVRDPTMLDELNDRLIDNFKNKKDIFLMVPEIIDWEGVQGFSYTQKGKVYPDLSIDHFWEEKKIETITMSKLKNHKIYCHYSETSSINWSVFNCLSSEIREKDKTYVFCIGKWFEVKDDLVSNVNKFIEEIDISSIKFPEINGEYEEEANEIFSNQLPGLLNLDRKNMIINGDKYEVCDLLSKDKEFIHIKWWDSSATLSHLFSQGRVSAEILSRDQPQREEICGKISQLDPKFDSVIEKENYSSNDYTIVYGIIYKGDKKIADRLPFFSAVNLMHSVQQLRNMRYKVEIAHIKSKSDRKKKEDNATS